MSKEEKTGWEKIGGFAGLAGILVLLASRLLSLDPRTRSWIFLAGMALLLVACCLIGVEQYRKGTGRGKAVGAVIFLIVIYNLFSIYRSLFVTGTLDIF